MKISKLFTSNDTVRQLYSIGTTGTVFITNIIMTDYNLLVSQKVHYKYYFTWKSLSDCDS